MLVQPLMADHGMCQRRACSASGVALSTLRYRLVPRDDSGVIAFIQGHMALNPRHGFDLLFDSARHQMQPWGKTVLWRVYNQGWSCDFMSDALWSGRCFRTFNVIDEYNREGLRIEIDTSLPAARVICALDELVEVRGAPLSIRLDNGPEFIAHAPAQWANPRALPLTTSNPESLRRTPMSNDSKRPTEPRCWTATSLIHCMRSGK